MVFYGKYLPGVIKWTLWVSKVRLMSPPAGPRGQSPASENVTGAAWCRANPEQLIA